MVANAKSSAGAAVTLTIPAPTDGRSIRVFRITRGLWGSTPSETRSAKGSVTLDQLNAVPNNVSTVQFDIPELCPPNTAFTVTCDAASSGVHYVTVVYDLV